MKLKNRIDKIVQVVSQKFSGGGVSQKENTASGKREPFGNMTELVRPVSYTHLRAHEPSLDVVGRLLLE